VVGLQALIKTAIETDVIFIADIDYFMPYHVLSGALKYVAKGHSVYMPVPWMVQGSDVIEQGTDHVDGDLCKERNLRPQCSIDDYTGSFNKAHYMNMPSQLRWAIGGYGPIAFYKEDFDGIGGLDIKRFGTKKDFEDTDLAYRFFSCNLLLIRGPTYNFVHLPHPVHRWGTESGERAREDGPKT